MRLHYYYASSRKYTELLVATLAAFFALVWLAVYVDSTVVAHELSVSSPAAGVASAASAAKEIATRSLTTVSAASFRSDEISCESVVAAFGSGLASEPMVANEWPLPESLSGTKVLLRDALGREVLAPLFFVSPGQVNFFIPLNMANGEASVTITSNDGTVSQGALKITDVAPGLFAMNANGSGVAAATVLRVRGSARYYEIMSRYDLDLNKWVTLPIDFGTAADRVFVAFYGTGIRGRASLSDVQMTIGGEPVSISYAGPQGNLMGVDQVNAEIPRTLAGRGEVDVVMTVNGKPANTVCVNLR
jgi:uncharacterized protein (TIGR03437 family)